MTNVAGEMQGRVALVMGGGAGTGRAISLAFAAAGARVVVADINVDGGRETAALIAEQGGESLFVRADMAVAAQVAQAVAAAQAAYGGLHMAANNGALGIPGRPLAEVTEEEWDRCMAVTLRGVWLCMKHQLPAIEASGGGAIVNVASVSALRGEIFLGP